MGSKKFVKRGPYKKKNLDEDLETPWNKNTLQGRLNLIRGRIRMFTATMRGIRYKINIRRGELNVRLMQEYQDLNRQLYRAKKVENVLTYQKNML